MGLEPACVVVCPVEAILVGDMNDPNSRVAHIVNRDAVEVRRPEKETLPKLFYKGAHQATLDPLAARRPEGGLFMWSEQKQDAATVNSGNPLFYEHVGRRAPRLRRPALAPLGLARQPLHVDEGHRGGRLPRRGAAPPARLHTLARCLRRVHRLVSGFPRYASVAVGRARHVGRVPRDHGRAAHLGLGAPRTLLPDLHASAVAKLARQGRVHHRGLLARPRAPFHREPCGNGGRPDSAC